MTRIVLIISILAFSFTLLGCQAPKAKPAAIPSAAESSAIENVNVKRMAYLGSLAQIVDYYTRTGNQMKLNWALREMTSVTTAANVPVKALSAPLNASERDLLEQLAQDRQAYITALDQLAAATNNQPAVSQAGKEIAAVKAAPQYTYIVEAQVAGPDLRAMSAIPQADKLFEQARKLDNDARAAVVAVDQAKLRQAIGIYDQLIKQYPTSDKIGLAAYYAGMGYESLKDYAIAALYFERAAQWDANIKVPTRFRAAYMYDRFLNNRQKALQLYQDSLNHEFSNSQYRAYANNRIIILSKKELQ